MFVTLALALAASAIAMATRRSNRKKPASGGGAAAAPPAEQPAAEEQLPADVALGVPDGWTLKLLADARDARPEMDALLSAYESKKGAPAPARAAALAAVLAYRASDPADPGLDALKASAVGYELDAEVLGTATDNLLGKRTVGDLQALLLRAYLNRGGQNGLRRAAELGFTTERRRAAVKAFKDFVKTAKRVAALPADLALGVPEGWTLERLEEARAAHPAMRDRLDAYERAEGVPDRGAALAAVLDYRNDAAPDLALDVVLDALKASAVGREVEKTVLKAAAPAGIGEETFTKRGPGEIQAVLLRAYINRGGRNGQARAAELGFTEANRAAAVQAVRSIGAPVAAKPSQEEGKKKDQPPPSRRRRPQSPPPPPPPVDVAPYLQEDYVAAALGRLRALVRSLPTGAATFARIAQLDADVRRQTTPPPPPPLESEVEEGGEQAPAEAADA